ncbi:hypothetical protein V6N13_132577 [Hibiscus sabdariffa]
MWGIGSSEWHMCNKQVVGIGKHVGLTLKDNGLSELRQQPARVLIGSLEKVTQVGGRQPAAGTNIHVYDIMA